MGYDPAVVYGPTGAGASLAPPSYSSIMPGYAAPELAMPSPFSTDSLLGNQSNSAPTAAEIQYAGLEGFNAAQSDMPLTLPDGSSVAGMSAYSGGSGYPEISSEMPPMYAEQDQSYGYGGGASSYPTPGLANIPSNFGLPGEGIESPGEYPEQLLYEAPQGTVSGAGTTATNFGACSAGASTASPPGTPGSSSDATIQENTQGWKTAYGQQNFVATAANGDMLSRGTGGNGDNSSGGKGEELDLHIASDNEDIQQWGDGTLADHSNNGASIEVTSSGELYETDANGGTAQDLGKASNSSSWSKIDAGSANGPSTQAVSDFKQAYTADKDGQNLLNTNMAQEFGSQILQAFTPGGVAGALPQAGTPKENLTLDLTQGITQGAGTTSDGKNYDIAQDQGTGESVIKYSDGSAKVSQGTVALDVDSSGNVTLDDNGSTSQLSGGTISSSSVQNQIQGLVSSGTITQQEATDLIQAGTSQYSTAPSSSNPFASSQTSTTSPTSTTSSSTS